MKTTLVILAAGIGSRFGGGIKQLEPVGPHGEIIMDYSIKAAIEAGFDKVVFIIRKDLEKDFKEIIGSRIEKLIEVDYAYQELDKLPEGYTLPVGRTKPWGTGHALLVCKDVVKEPFIVINADDYYGKEAFVKLHDFLIDGCGKEGEILHYGMAGFILKNTLSENGAVTRGVCQVDESGMLKDIVETKGIEKKADHVAVCKDGVEVQVLPEDSNVSMNMWALDSAFIEMLEGDFKAFLDAVPEGDLTAEYLLPTIVGEYLKEGKLDVKVMETHDKWYGITYKEDAPYVKEVFKSMDI